MLMYKNPPCVDTALVSRGRATGLFGRDADLERARAALREGSGWIALVGLPGVGKSAVLRALSRELSAGGRRVHVGLATLPEARAGDVLVHDDLDEGTVSDVVPKLRAASAAGVAVITASLAAPGADEHALRLAPLAVPARDAAAADVHALASTQLLLAAARRRDASPDIEGTRLAALCAVLRASSGLPLVIELVAANLPVMSLEEIADALSRPSSFGATQGLDRVARHATVGAAFARVLDSLSVEAHAQLLHAAPHLAGIDAPPAGTAALAAVRTLVELGLIEREPDDAGRARLRVPTLVGRLVLESARADLVEDASRRHLEQTMRRSCALVADYELRGDRAALARLDALADDIDAALFWAEATERIADAVVDDVVRAAIGPGRVRPQGTPEATLARLERLARRLDPPPGSALVRIAIERAANAERDTRVEEARALLDRASHVAALSPAARSELAMARGRHALAFERDYPAARAFFEEAARSDDPGVRGRALISRGNGFAWSEQYEEAADEYARALEVIRGTGASRLETIVLTNLCLIHAGHWPSERSRTPRTSRLADGRRALGLFREAGDLVGVGIAGTHVAITATTVLRFETAEDEFLAALEALTLAASPNQTVVALADLGDVRHALGDDAGAAAFYGRASEFADRAGDRLLGAVASAQQGSLALERGEAGVARERLEAARALLGEHDAHANQLGLVLAQLALLDQDRAPALLARARELVGSSASAHRHAVDLYGLVLADRQGRLDRERLDEIAAPWARSTMRLMRVPEATRGEDGYGIPWHVWVALRRVLRELDDERRRRVIVGALGLDADGKRAVVLDVDRRALRTSDGQWVDLSNRSRPFALLTALADAAHDGAASLGVGELVARVWPDERMLPTAGANRVYAAISTLRKAGDVPDLIVREAEGYRLAPGFEIAVWRDQYRAHRAPRAVPQGLITGG